MTRFRRTIVFVIAALLAWAGAVGVAWADRRVALVVGNSAYRHVTALPNPRNDASDVAEVLRGLDFEVISALDADSAGFNRGLSEFSRQAVDADAALFFYAGHGIQVRGENYFLPIDADARDENDAEFSFVAMEKVRRALDKAAGDSVRIMVLDACRDNPLARTIAMASRGVSEPTRGLARIDMQASGGAIIVYATQPNQVAQDGSERNSPFTSSFLKQLKEPSVEVSDLFRRVLSDVRNKTNGKQVPELSISLGREYYLNRKENDATAYDRVADSDNPKDFQDFIARFPTSARVPRARRQIDLLESTIAQRLAAARLEAERLARLEVERKETERRAADKLDAERLETQRLAAAKVESDRLARIEADRKEADRAAAARLEADRKEVERLAAAKADAERRAAAQDGGSQSAASEPARHVAPAPNEERAAALAPPSKVQTVAALADTRADRPLSAPPSAQMVKDAQILLRRLGCYSGKTDGALPPTLKALALYGRKVNAPRGEARTLSPAVLEELNARKDQPCAVKARAPAPRKVRVARPPAREAFEAPAPRAPRWAAPPRPQMVPLAPPPPPPPAPYGPRPFQWGHPLPFF